MTPEGKVKEQVKKILAEYGVIKAAQSRKTWPKEVRGWYYMPVGNGMGVHGIPDFICCVGGNFLSIETKAKPGDTYSPHQAQRAEEIQAGGGVAVLVDGGDVSIWALRAAIENNL